MQTVKSVEDISSLNDNFIFGAVPADFNKSCINFSGHGNILFIEEGVKFNKTTINFSGSKSVVYLSASRHYYNLNLTLYNKCTFFIGKNNYMNDVLNIIVSEHCNVFIGDEGLFSFGVWIRTADPHLIYSTHTKERINPSKSVFIGDHIWVGQGALILKGTKLHSGGILGAGAVAAGRKTGSNESWAGNPAQLIASDIFWERTCVHTFTKKDTKAHRVFNNDDFIYSYSQEEYIPFEELDKRISTLKTPEDKLECFKQLVDSKTKNRFAFVNKKRGLFHRQQRKK